MPPKAKRGAKKKAGGRSKKATVYLDNNGTTMASKESVSATTKWLKNHGNPSATSGRSQEARKMIDSARAYIRRHCGAPGYRVVFTSGASESNSLIIRSCVEAYVRTKKAKAHVLTSLTEHKSVLETCRDMAALGLADISYISPNIYGCINSQVVARSIKSNTCLITIMAANNELGCINDIAAIGAAAHAANVPFHSDCVQTFGKFRYKLPAMNIDAISMSFHKLYGPMGCGMLVINEDLISGYKLKGQIAGSQQGGLRGGTENVPAIAGSVAALKGAFEKRAEKNRRMASLKKYIITEIGKKYPITNYPKYVAPSGKTFARIEIVPLGPKNPKISLPNTLLLSIAKNSGAPFCNVKLKRGMERAGISVSIGSACNTSSTKASHVLAAIRAPDVIKRGVIRISLCDSSTKADAAALISTLCKLISAQSKA